MIEHRETGPRLRIASGVARPWGRSPDTASTVVADDIPPAAPAGPLSDRLVRAALGPVADILDLAADAATAIAMVSAGALTSALRHGRTAAPRAPTRPPRRRARSC